MFQIAALANFGESFDDIFTQNVFDIFEQICTKKGAYKETSAKVRQKALYGYILLINCLHN